MFVIESVEDARRAIGTELGTSEWFAVDQRRIDRFAESTDDRQWIHVDVERAAAGPYGTTIAHGFLTLSLLPHLLREVYAIKGATMGVNYGLDTVRFLTPVPVGSRVRARASLVSADMRGGKSLRLGVQAVVELEGAERPACSALMIGLYRFPDDEEN